MEAIVEKAVIKKVGHVTPDGSAVGWEFDGQGKDIVGIAYTTYSSDQPRVCGIPIEDLRQISNLLGVGTIVECA